MIGLEKVTGRIIANAEAEAARIMAAAEEKCAAADAECDEKIAALNARVNAEVDTEGENIISRAKSAAATERRNILLTAKAEAVDAAFAAAESKLCLMPRENYISFIMSLIGRAVADSEASAAGSGHCELTFNRRDTDEVAAEIRGRLAGEYPADKVTFTLSGRCAAISGGVLLDFGDMDIDCSLGVIISQLRPALEGAVCDILFGGGAV